MLFFGDRDSINLMTARNFFRYTPGKLGVAFLLIWIWAAVVEGFIGAYTAGDPFGFIEDVPLLPKGTVLFLTFFFYILVSYVSACFFWAIAHTIEHALASVQRANFVWVGFRSKEHFKKMWEYAAIYTVTAWVLLFTIFFAVNNPGNVMKIFIVVLQILWLAPLVIMIVLSFLNLIRYIFNKSPV